jgi:acyl carrier protein
MTTNTETMSRQQIFEAVCDTCVEVLEADRTTLSEATELATDLEADSLALVEIVMQLEERFDVRIPEDELGDVARIGEAVDLVARHLERSA